MVGFNPSINKLQNNIQYETHYVFRTELLDILIHVEISRNIKITWTHLSPLSESSINLSSPSDRLSTSEYRTMLSIELTGDNIKCLAMSAWKM